MADLKNRINFGTMTVNNIKRFNVLSNGTFEFFWGEDTNSPSQNVATRNAATPGTRVVSNQPFTYYEYDSSNTD